MSDSLQIQLAAVAPELVAGSNTAFFNPIEYIDSQMNEPALQFALASNAIWALDSSIVTAATSVYFEVMRNYPDVTAENLRDFVIGGIDHETFWGDGNTLRLVKLLSLQSGWHDVAYRMATAEGRDSWKPKTIFELTRSQSAMKLSANQDANLKVAGKFIAEMSEGEVNEVQAYEQLKAALTSRNQSMADMRRGIAPSVEAIVTEATHHLDAFTFGDLSTTQRLFIMRSNFNAIARALTDLARLDTGAYMLVIAEAAITRKAYKRVIDKLVADLDRERTSS